MNLFAISGILAGMTSLGMALFIFIKGKQPYHYLWGVFCVSVAFWGFGAYQIATAQSLQEGVFWWRIAYIGVIWIPLLFLHFVHLFLGLRNRALIAFIYVLGVFFSYVNLGTDIFINNARFLFDQFYYATPTPLFKVYTVLFFTTVFYSHWLLYKGMKDAPPFKRLQIRYFFFAMLVSYAGGSTSYLPHYGVDFYPYFNMTVFLYPLIVGYAIFRYRLMDIRFVVKRSTVFAFLVAAITGIYALMVTLTSALIQQSMNVNPTVFTGLFIGVLIAVGFDPLKSFLEMSTDKVFYKYKYNSEDYIVTVGKMLSHTLELSRLIRELAHSFVETFKTSKIAVLLLDRKSGYYKIEYNFGFTTFSSVSFSRTNAVIQFIAKRKETLVNHEFARSIEECRARVSKKMIQEIEKSGVELYVPLIHQDVLIGLILLGDKKSGDAYNETDLRVLSIISRQAAITFTNAKLYQETKQFNIILREEVEKAVSDLKKANARLQELDRAKSEFISIASHQLRTPLTIIKGYISMLLDGSFGKVTDQKGEPLEKVFVINERLINLVEDLLNVSRIEQKRMQYDFEATDIVDLMASVIDELAPNAKAKGLTLDLSKAENIPKIMLDADKMRQVIMNLVDNAIKYTNQGSVHVSLERQGKKIICRVQDTGIGLTAGGIAKLFEKFSRVGGSATQNTQGSGLGLFVAKKIVEAHQGRIWVESPGEGKGSTFI